VGGAFLRTLPARLLDQRLGTFKRRVLITLPLERRRGPGTAEALVRRKRARPQDHPLAVAPVRFEDSASLGRKGSGVRECISVLLKSQSLASTPGMSESDQLASAFGA
jgi:hypothetical protein